MLEMTHVLHLTNVVHPTCITFTRVDRDGDETLLVKVRAKGSRELAVN